jgi:[acyl-carrier-protein] S-malonyltransferase
MRRGPHAALLPREDGAEGRQLRRWLVQLVTCERLICSWADRNGIDVDANDLRPWRPDSAASLELGSVTCAVLVSCPRARAVFRTVTSAVDIPESQVLDCFERHAPKLARPARSLVRYRLFPDAVSASAARDHCAPADFFDDAPEALPGAETLGWVRPDQFAGALGGAIVTAVRGVPTAPVPFADGWAVVVVDSVEPATRASFAERRDAIRADLLGALRRHAFVGWLDAQRQARVRLRPGYEHPADDRQPDNTHRH